MRCRRGEGWRNGHHASEFIAVLPENLETNGRKAYQFDWPFVEG